MGVLLGSRSGSSLVCATLFVILATRASRLPVRAVLGNLRPLTPILILTFALNAWATSGRPAIPIPLGLGALTYEGLARGLFLVFRLSALVLGTSLLTLTTSPLGLADGLESLLSPLKRLRVPVHELAMTTTIALRFVPMLVDEVDRLQKAQLARGADFTGGPIKRVRAVFPLLLPLLVSAFGRADRLAVAMEARCYGGDVGRTRYRVLVFSGRDWQALVGILAAAVLALSAGSLSGP